MKTNLSSFLQTKTNFSILCCLHRHQLAYYYLLALFWIYFLLQYRQKKAIKATVKKTFPHLTPSELKYTLKGIYRGIFKHYWEKFHNLLTPTPQLLTFFKARINGHTKLQEFLDSRQNGNGVLLLTAHFGGVEYFSKYFTLNKHSTSIIARFSSGRPAEIAYKQSEELGINVINDDTTDNVIAKMFEDLKNGRIVIFLIDELSMWKWKKKIPTISFLNQPLPLFKGLSAIMEKCRLYDIPIFFGALRRDPGDSYEFIAEKLAVGPSHDNEPALKATNCLQRLIFNDPSLWYHWSDLHKTLTA
jgi:Kdo2-lipid IVA lauroyltransferase/acyltransferase